MKHLKALLCALVVAMASPLQAADGLQRFEPGDMERLVASQQGKRFVLVLWSLDCVYCQASLKTLVEEQRRRKNFAIVTLATDSLYDPDAVAMIRSRLVKAGLAGKGGAWAFGSASPEELRYAVDPKWHGELPRTYWFDTDGRRAAYSGQITREVLSKFAVQW